MDKRITFKDIKTTMDKIQAAWVASENVVVIYDQYVADVLQELLDEINQGIK